MSEPRRYQRKLQQWKKKDVEEDPYHTVNQQRNYSNRNIAQRSNYYPHYQQRNHSYHSNDRQNIQHRSNTQTYEYQHSNNHNYNHPYKAHTNRKRPNIGPQPRGLKKKRLFHLSKYQYWVTEKSDGMRLIAYITDQNTYFMDRKHNMHLVTHAFYHGSHGFPPNTILDGELIRMQINNTMCDRLVICGFIRNIQHKTNDDYHDAVTSIINDTILQYYHVLCEYEQLTYKIFDCIVYDGMRVTKLNSSKRFLYIDRFIRAYNKQLLRFAATDNTEVNHASELSHISRQEDNKDPNVELLKDRIWNMIKRDTIDIMDGNNKIDSNKYHDDAMSVLQKRLPLIFSKKTFYKSIQNDMKILFSRIKKESGEYYYIDLKQATRNKNDGVVFTPENNNYFMNRKGSNVDHIRKWKPLELNTIDVKIKIYSADSYEIMDKFRDYDGFVSLYVMDWDRNKEVVFDAIDIGWNQNQLNAFQRNQQHILRNIYTESNAEWNRFNYLIVECCYDFNVQSWKILKWRMDKRVANALNVCNNARVMISEGGIQPNDLIHACSISYKQLQIVRNYNDKAANMSMIQRENSPTKHIRDMNNWCKYALILHGIRDAYVTNDNHKIHVFDLACGKGGDLIKFRGNKKYVSLYLGVDIASECVEKAKHHYQIMKRESAKRKYDNYDSYKQRKRFGVNNAYGQTADDFYNEPIFDGEFLCYDMVSTNLYKHESVRNKAPFHLINIQFAVHYAFQSKYTLNALLNTISACTKPGSYLICSFVRDEEIINRLKSCDMYQNDVVFRNKFQSIGMKKEDFERIMKVYEQYNLLNMDSNRVYSCDDILDDISDRLVGIPYIYYQMNSVDHVEEYLVSFWYLCNVLWKSCKMKLVFRKTRQQMKDEYSDKAPFKYGYLKRQLPQTWSKDEQQVLDTYAYAMFQRV